MMKYAIYRFLFLIKRYNPGEIDKISADLEAEDIEQSEPDDTEVQTNSGCEQENPVFNCLLFHKHCMYISS